MRILPVEFGSVYPRFCRGIRVGTLRSEAIFLAIFLTRQ